MDSFRLLTVGRAALPMNSPVCHPERREESSRIMADAYATGSFAWLRMTAADCEG